MELLMHGNYHIETAYYRTISLHVSYLAACAKFIFNVEIKLQGQGQGQMYNFCNNLIWSQCHNCLKYNQNIGIYRINTQ